MNALEDKKINRVALYARVSTSDKGQDPELQLMPLREYCKQRGWQVVDEFVDVGISGTKAKRPQLDRLLNACRKRQINTICIWKMDRIGRSLKNLVFLLDEFQELGVAFVSYSEALDFSSASGKLLANLLACFCQYEKDLISERVRAGMMLAKMQNRSIGRKPTAPDKLASIITEHENNLSVRQIATKVKIPRSTVFRTIKQFKSGGLTRDGQLVKVA